jgi:hypothetical protein
MGIAPIDLQTLFTQLDKVARTYASQKEGQALQQAVQGAQIQKKTEEQIQQVNEAQNTGEGAEKINDHGKREHGEGKKKERGQKEEDEDEKTASVLSDPSLGRNIDISL